VISEPDYFEKSILPKILASEEEIANPIDIVTKEILSESPITCKNVRDIIHDYTMLPNRQPKILMQTVMHISGCAYLYQKADVTNVEGNRRKRILYNESFLYIVSIYKIISIPKSLINDCQTILKISGY